MHRDFKKLENSIFDLVIVGAGIHGAILALEATRQGYKVALLDKDDFGSATSANSLKIVHGGIRYLQHGDLRRMRESIRSRRAMMTFAPHLVRPLECMMPTYGHGMRGKEIMRLAFGVYDVIASDRNCGLPQEKQLPNSTSISAREVTWAVPGINSDGLTGGAIWYDAIADNTERLILEYVKESMRYGAVACNYAKVTELLTDENRVSGVVVHDELHGGTWNLKCRMVVNAAGPWLADLGTSQLGSQLWASALNVVIKRRLFKKYAVGLEGYTEYADKDALIKRGKRLFFFVPWLDKYTMIGTSYKPYHGDPDDFSVTREDIEELLADINKIYPQGDLCMEDVGYYHGGLLPMNEADDSRPDSVQLDKSSMIIDHAENGGPFGLLSIKGVKYTTAPDIAEKVMAIASRPEFLGERQVGSYTDKQAAQLDFGPVISRFGKQYSLIRAYLEKKYGSGWREVFSVLVSEYQKNPGSLDDENLWLVEEPKLLQAELLHFIRNEMAEQLPDALFRRSELASAECPDDAVLESFAVCMGEELGWTAEERLQQIEMVKRAFLPLTARQTETLEA